MTKPDPETLLKTLADATAPDKERAAAADDLASLGRCVVMNKQRSAVQVEETLDMWELPAEFTAQLTTFTRKQLPVRPAHDVLPVENFERDPISLEPLVDGFNSASGADWKPVKHKWRALVRWATERGQLHVDPANLAADLARGELSERLKRCRAEATKEELARCAEQLKGQRRATAHHAQRHQMRSDETVIRVAGSVRGNVVGSGVTQVFTGPVGAVQTGGGNVTSVTMGSAPLRLGDFLAGAFDVSELKRFMGQYYPSVEAEIAWHGLGRADAAWDTAKALRRRGMVNERLRACLLAERPSRASEVARVA